MNESPTPTPRKRCAIVECYKRHDEVYLTTVSLLEQLGYEVHVFNVWRNRMKNSFVHAPGLSPRIHSRFTAAGVLDAVRRQNFDVVVFNTLEGSEVLACAREVLRDTPVLGFVHNGGMVCDREEYVPLLRDPRLRLMTLASYIGEHFAHRAPAGTLTPVFFFDRPVPRLPRTDGRRRFCVQGYFDPGRRHYDQLLSAMRQLRDEGRTDFEMYIMGRSFDRRFRDFARQVRAAGLAPQVRYSWKGIGYRSYYRLLNSMDFILPLISPDSHPVYFQSKSTSSIAAAIGFNAVPVTHERLAQLYSLGDAAITYTGDLLPALRRALDCDEAELAALRARVAAVKQRCLRDSRRELEKALAAVGAETAHSPSMVANGLPELS